MSSKHSHDAPATAFQGGVAAERAHVSHGHAPHDQGSHNHAHHDHDHGHCAHADARQREAPQALADAERLCRERGVRLTDLRRSVLEALYETHRPLGAYDLADILAARSGKRIAPITVYRVLEFLTEQGFVHRLVTRNAFIACPHAHNHDDVTVFLICARCGGVDEMASGEVRAAIDGLLARSNFQPSVKIVEIDGVCAHCQTSGQTSGPTSTTSLEHPA